MECDFKVGEGGQDPSGDKRVMLNGIREVSGSRYYMGHTADKEKALSSAPMTRGIVSDPESVAGRMGYNRSWPVSGEISLRGHQW
jgi:hypothetical protein